MTDIVAKTYDAVIVPGGGLEPGSSVPQPWVRARLDEALKHSNKTQYYVVLSRGTTHRPPPTDSRGFPIDEAGASAKYLLDHGVDDSSRILVDSWSLDTIGNAFFARQMICVPMRLCKILVITSQFHMPRTRAIFEWVFALDKRSASLDYCVTEDIGMSNEQRESRIEKEQESLKVLEESTLPRISTLAMLSQFLFQRHGAYSAQSARQIRARDSARQEEGKVETGESIVTSTY